MKKVFAIALCMLLCCTMALAESEPTVFPRFGMDDYPIVNGSTATLPLSYALMQAVTGCSAEDAKLSITHTKTTNSYYDLVDGRCDILLVYRPSDDAYTYAQDSGVELLETAIGRDAMVFLINNSNPVKSLSSEQLQRIYTGDIVNWSEVGGTDQPIIAYQRPEDSGSQVMMRKQVMQGLTMMEAPISQTTSEMGELIDAIAAYANEGNAIGYSVYYYVANMYIQDGVQLLNVDGIVPDNESIGNGDYPFTQDFYVVIRADEPDNSPARQLYDFLCSPEATGFIENAGYVPVYETAYE